MAGLTPDSLCFKMGRVMRRMQAYYQARLSPLGLTPTQSYVLSMLHLNDGMTLGDLGERVALDPSTLTGVIDRMERDGFVRRQHDTEDRRAIRVHLTEKAKEVEPQVRVLSKEFDALLRASFKPEEMATFERVLVSLAELAP